jgi:DNA-binding transcriptional MerR regulator
MPDGIYSLSDLCDLADVTPRTVRYYISQGLLRSPGTSGPGARYDDGHLARLRLIRRLQREHLPLAEIRSRLAAISDEEAIVQSEGPTGPPADSALDYVREVLGAGSLGTPAAGTTHAAARPPTGPAARPVAPFPERPGPIAREMAPPSPRRSLSRADLAAPEPSIAEPAVAERSQWERFVLAPDVELHVRRPLTRTQNRAVARLLEAARRLLEEDQP